jgi:hypothetical protein
MKKILLILFMVLILFGCKKEEVIVEENNTTVVEKTEEEKKMYDFLTNNVLTTSVLSENRCLVFTEDGRFLRYYSSEILFPTSQNVLLIAGTYEYKDNTLYLNNKVYYSLDYDDATNSILFHKSDDNRTYKYENYPLVDRESYGERQIYAGGYNIFRLDIADPEKVPEALSTYLKNSLLNDLQDFDLDKVKSLEGPFE